MQYPCPQASLYGVWARAQLVALSRVFRRFAHSKALAVLIRAHPLSCACSPHRQTAVAFRRAVRQVKMARLAYRIYGRTRGLQGYTGDRGAGSSLKQHRDSGQDGDGDGDGDEVPFAGGLLADPDSVVNRSLQQKISIMVIFTGVLLSIAIVQLYAVGTGASVSCMGLCRPPSTRRAAVCTRRVWDMGGYTNTGQQRCAFTSGLALSQACRSLPA